MTDAVQKTTSPRTLEEVIASPGFQAAWRAVEANCLEIARVVVDGEVGVPAGGL